jgi:hypothetical protein
VPTGAGRTGHPPSSRKAGQIGRPAWIRLEPLEQRRDREARGVRVLEPHDVALD